MIKKNIFITLSMFVLILITMTSDRLDTQLKTLDKLMN